MLIKMKDFSYCLFINSTKMLVNKTAPGQGDGERKKKKLALDLQIMSVGCQLWSVEINGL